MKTLVTISARIDRTQANMAGIRGAQPMHKLTYEKDDESGKSVLVKIDGRRLADDPLAKPMRKPNTYESIIIEIENAPMTWLPAILAKAISECAKKSVYKNLDQFLIFAGAKFGTKPPF